MKRSKVLTLLLIGVLLLVENTRAVQIYWPFNPFFEQINRQKSPSQGECIDTMKIAKRSCSDGNFNYPIAAKLCYDHCQCSEGILKCKHFGDCDSQSMTKWCRCPDGKTDKTDCGGFMTLCYCTPEDGFAGKGPWGAGTSAIKRDLRRIGMPPQNNATHLKMHEAMTDKDATNQS